jgi:hypothetical protein
LIGNQHKSILDASTGQLLRPISYPVSIDTEATMRCHFQRHRYGELRECALRGQGKPMNKAGYRAFPKFVLNPVLRQYDVWVLSTACPMREVDELRRVSVGRLNAQFFVVVEDLVAGLAGNPETVHSSLHRQDGG